MIVLYESQSLISKVVSRETFDSDSFFFNKVVDSVINLLNLVIFYCLTKTIF